MSLEDLEPVQRELTMDEWVAAAVIGGLRMEGNRSRAARRDRGTEKNALNELQGVIGELACLARLEDAFPSLNLRQELFRWGTGASPSLQLSPDASIGEVAVEAKCHFDAPNKRRFLINDAAYSRSRDRGAVGFLPVVTSPGGARCMVGRLIPIDDVEEWKVGTLGTHSDPARQISLDALSPGVWDAPWGEVRHVGESKVVPKEGLRALVDGASRIYRELQREGFELPHGRADAVKAAADLTNRAWRSRDQGRWPMSHLEALSV